MMDWLIAIWNKVNKPLHYIAVGTAIIFLAQENIRNWGWLFIALGLIGSIEWVYNIYVQPILLKHLNTTKFKKLIRLLNSKEKELLTNQLRKKEQTFWIDDNDDNRLEMRVYRDLEKKEFLDIEYRGHMISDTPSTYHITINPDIWDMLVKGLSKCA